MVTIYDIARKANVSPMTVSRVINHSPHIREETRLKVEEAIRELDYIPNRRAQSLVSKETKLVSLVITDISNPFFTSITRGAEDKAIEMGYQVLLSNTDESADKESKYIDLAIATGVDGVIITPTGDASEKSLEKLTKRKIPFVLLDRSVNHIQADIVKGDNVTAMRKLVDHLIEQGHSKIALINGPETVSTVRERHQAFTDCMQLAGLEAKKEWMFHTHFKQDNFEEIVRKIFSFPADDKPTAILAASNFIGVNTVRAVRSLNLRVPEDIAVACFDDPEIIPDYNPFLTVVAQPAYDIGSIGMQMLIERIEGHAPAMAREVVMPAKMQIRKSSSLARKT